MNTPWAYGDSNSGWCVGWLVFFLVPIVPSLVDAIIARRFTRFAFPVVVVTTYLALGMLLGLWHPTWVMFFAIPLYYIIFNPIDHLFDKRKLKKEFGVEGDVVLDIDDEDDEDE